ncbi:hypothetical protein [Sorangium sp. So ce1153]|uniref:hypothetical protein n=1 Tax=Sorangium sp. So ce1153 TaxID=3133333 RepID=UPI003F5DF736
MRQCEWIAAAFRPAPRCCCDPIGGAITIDEISAIQGAATVTQAGPAALSVTVSEEGTSTFEASGGQLADEDDLGLPLLAVELRCSRFQASGEAG